MFRFRFLTTMPAALMLASVCFFGSGAAPVQAQEGHVNQKLDQIIDILKLTNQRFGKVENRLELLEQRVFGNPPSPGYSPIPAVTYSPGAATPPPFIAPNSPLAVILGYGNQGGLPPLPFAPADANERRILEQIFGNAAHGRPIQPLSPSDQSIMENFFARATSNR